MGAGSLPHGYLGPNGTLRVKKGVCLAYAGKRFTSLMGNLRRLFTEIGGAD